MLTWTEIFYSLQGEGIRVGTPSVFVRMFGCNLKCQGFGMPLGQVSNEFLGIDVKKYKKFEDLPLVGTGCDSYPSWDPRCKHLTTKGTYHSLVESVINTLPDGLQVAERPLQGIDVVFTGGEPLLGWQNYYKEVIDSLYSLGCRNITFETNGTKQFILTDLPSDMLVTFSISWKLPRSGELLFLDDYRSSLASLIFASVNHEAFFKFVISNESDVPDVLKVCEAFPGVTVYLMPTGGLLEEYSSNSAKVAKICMDNKWNYSPRLQLDLFANNWGT